MTMGPFLGILGAVFLQSLGPHGEGYLHGKLWEHLSRKEVQR